MLTLADNVQSLQHRNFCFILYLVLAVLFLHPFFSPLKNFFPVGHEGLDPFFLSTVYHHLYTTGCLGLFLSFYYTISNSELIGLGRGGALFPMMECLITWRQLEKKCCVWCSFL
nr:hypothetical protein CFP56_51053 [Quercus suber]